jgi:hypothetical protein
MEGLYPQASDGKLGNEYDTSPSDDRILIDFIGGFNLMLPNEGWN